MARFTIKKVEGQNLTYDVLDAKLANSSVAKTNRFYQAVGIAIALERLANAKVKEFCPNEIRDAVGTEELPSWFRLMIENTELNGLLAKGRNGQ